MTVSINGERLGFHAVNEVYFKASANSIVISKRHFGFGDDCYDETTGTYRNWVEEVAVIPREIWESVYKSCKEKSHE